MVLTFDAFDCSGMCVGVLTLIVLTFDALDCSGICVGVLTLDVGGGKIISADTVTGNSRPAFYNKLR